MSMHALGEPDRRWTEIRRRSHADGEPDDGFAAHELLKLLRLLEHLGDLEGLTVLEPGCGSGRLTRLLASRVGSRGKVIAVDHDPRRVEEARRALLGVTDEHHRSGEHHRTGESRRINDLRRTNDAMVVFHCADATHFAHYECMVDRVIMLRVFRRLPDPEAALRNFARSLDPNGRLIIADLEGSEHWEVASSLGDAAGVLSHERLVRMLSAAGLRLRTLIDRGEEFFVEAVLGHGSGRAGFRAAV